MLLVRQKDRFDCGIAVAAMVAQVPYEAILDRLITGLTTNNALSQHILWRVLQDVTQMEWCMQEFWRPWPQLGVCTFQDVPTVVLVQCADGSRHYIAVYCGLVYDPLLELPVTQVEYAERNYWVVTVFRPKAS
jgi:hypothetical protein